MAIVIDWCFKELVLPDYTLKYAVCELKLGHIFIGFFDFRQLLNVSSLWAPIYK